MLPHSASIDTTDPRTLAMRRVIDAAEAWHLRRDAPTRQRACDAIAAFARACGLPPDHHRQIVIAVSTLLDQPRRGPADAGEPPWQDMPVVALDADLADGSAELVMSGFLFFDDADGSRAGVEGPANPIGCREADPLPPAA